MSTAKFTTVTCPARTSTLSRRTVSNPMARTVTRCQPLRTSRIRKEPVLSVRAIQRLSTPISAPLIGRPPSFWCTCPTIEPDVCAARPAAPASSTTIRPMSRFMAVATARCPRSWMRSTPPLPGTSRPARAPAGGTETRDRRSAPGRRRPPPGTKGPPATHEIQRAAVIGLGAAENGIDAVAHRAADYRDDLAARDRHVARDAEAKVQQRVGLAAGEHLAVDARVAVTREVQGVAIRGEGERRCAVAAREPGDGRRRAAEVDDQDAEPGAYRVHGAGAARPRVRHALPDRRDARGAQPRDV